MSCTPAELRNLIAEYGGGSDTRYRHPLARRVTFSPGMKAVAEAAGAFWLIDWIAFNAAPKYANAWLNNQATTGIFKIEVVDDRAKMTLSLEDDAPPVVNEELNFTTFPEGSWTFCLGTDEVGPEQYVTNVYLLSEY